jgi:hypothetical protein
MVLVNDEGNLSDAAKNSMWLVRAQPLSRSQPSHHGDPQAVADEKRALHVILSVTNHHCPPRLNRVALAHLPKLLDLVEPASIVKC